MLDLSIVRGPLQPAENEEILAEVNRLTDSRIALDQFCRWVQDSPDGPAFHALLRSGRRIVGHFSLIPLRANFQGRPVPVARTEYFFVHEDFRSEKVRGFTGSFLSPAILLLEQLYRHCQENGWGPFLVSAAEDILPFHQIVGCEPVDFALHECLFVLRPFQAARRTPNLASKQRAGLLAMGLTQSTCWNAVRPFLRNGNSIGTVPLRQAPIPEERTAIALFQDEPSRAWRFPESEYVCFADHGSPASYVIAKNGEEDRYLRVCQWQLRSPELAVHFVGALLRHAQRTGVPGVRWSLFESGEDSAAILRALRRLGFLCAPRVRKLLVRSDQPSFLDSSMWRLSDSLFCFDL
jgi:hypothetical protein